jgi:histidinol-phosphate phosphatase family protein
VILDRAGVINEDSDKYIKSADEWVPIPGSLEAIARLNQIGCHIVVVTNQSGIARGLITQEDLERLHRQINDAFRQKGARLDAYFHCPHHPTEGTGEHTRTCDCRKPQPGLLLRAAQELQLDLEASHMIGDKLRDIEAGHRAGCQSILVKTGYGQEELLLLNEEQASSSSSINPVQRPDHVSTNILEAVNWILEHNLEERSETTH